jgi:hypothetical protein
MDVLPCFVDETGVLHAPSQPLFAVGFLTVREIAELTDRLYTASLNFGARVRERRSRLLREIEGRQGVVRLPELHELLAKTRHHEYKFTELRNHNKDDYIALLDLFFSVAGSEFHCLLVERTAESLRFCGDDPWPVYVRVTKALLKRRLREPVFVCADWQTRPKHQHLRLENELSRLDHVAGCIRMASEMSALLQVVDLLLGVVSFDWRDVRGHTRESNNAQVKREIANFVKRRMGMEPSERFLAPGRRYFRRATPLAFSVWQPNPSLLKKAKTRGMYGVNSRLGND